MVIGSVFLYLAALAFGLFGAVDAAVRPFSHWERIGSSKAAWIVAQGLVLFPVIGLAEFVAAIVYLTRVRPKLMDVAEGLTP